LDSENRLNIKMPNIPTLTTHGCTMPQIGFGTSQLGDCGELVATALKVGYRHIDTAWKYGSEKGVGAGIRASGRAAQRNFPGHQGFARIPARRCLRKVRR